MKLIPGEMYRLLIDIYSSSSPYVEPILHTGDIVKFISMEGWDVRVKPLITQGDKIAYGDDVTLHVTGEYPPDILISMLLEPL